MLKFTRGFSFPELAVVVAIMGILFAIAMPAFSSWIADSRLRLKAESFIGGVNLARSEAIRRNAKVTLTFCRDPGDPVPICDATDLRGNWNIGCTSAPSDTCPITIEKRSFAEGGTGITLTTNGNADLAKNVITFSGFGLLVNEADTITQLDLSAPSGTSTRVLISNTGKARVCLPSRNTAGDPMNCVEAQ